MSKVPSSCVVGPSYLEAQFKSSHKFLFVYGTQTMVPIEVMVSSARLALASEASDPYDHIINEEPRRETAKCRRKMSIAILIELITNG